jgi:hypothetical protein
MTSTLIKYDYKYRSRFDRRSLNTKSKDTARYSFDHRRYVEGNSGINLAKFRRFFLYAQPDSVDGSSENGSYGAIEVVL